MKTTKYWIDENRDLYKGLEVGCLYAIFENEKPIKLKDAIIIKKTTHKTKTNNVKKPTTIRVSKKGNRIVTKIAICEECGNFKASMMLKKSICNKCLGNYRSQKQLVRYYKNKWYKNLKPGTIYCVFKGNEVLRLDSVNHLFKPGRKKLSPVTGSEYIGRICICEKCGEKRFSKVRLGGLCDKCQQIKHTKASKERKVVPTASEIAYEITGNYQRVESRAYVVDVFDEVERCFA